MKNRIRVYWMFYKLAGKPGIVLLGYNIVQLVFARANKEGKIDWVALVFALYSMYCLFVGLWEYNKRKRNYNEILLKSPLLFFVLYSVLGVISCMWSDDAAITAFRAMECLALTILVASVYMRLMKYRNVDLVYKWTMLYVIFDAVCKCVRVLFTQGTSFWIPGSAFWTICQFMMPIYFYLFFLNSNNKFFKYFVVIGSIFAKSTVGYIAIASGSICMFMGDRKTRNIGFMVLSIALICIVYWGLDEFMVMTISSEHDVTNLHDSSGRDEIWDIGWMAYSKSPIWGHGFFYYENYITKLMKGSYAIGMHNSYLSALVGEGIIGLVLFVLFMAGMCIYSVRKEIPQKYKASTISLMITITIETIANPSLGFRVYGCWLPSMVGVMLIIYMVQYGKFLYYDKKPSEFPVINKI